MHKIKTSGKNEIKTKFVQKNIYFYIWIKENITLRKLQVKYKIIIAIFCIFAEFQLTLSNKEYISNLISEKNMICNTLLWQY